MVIGLIAVQFCQYSYSWSFSSPGAAILLVSIKNRDLWPVQIFGHAQKILSIIKGQSDLSDLTMSPWIADFRCLEWPGVSILGADQKDRGLWERKWLVIKEIEPHSYGNRSNWTPLSPITIINRTYETLFNERLRRHFMSRYCQLYMDRFSYIVVVHAWALRKLCYWTPILDPGALVFYHVIDGDNLLSIDGRSCAGEKNSGVENDWKTCYRIVCFWSPCYRTFCYWTLCYRTVCYWTLCYRTVCYWTPCYQTFC